MMKEHALLHGGERIGILDIFRTHLALSLFKANLSKCFIKFILVEPREREIGWGVAARLRRPAVGNQLTQCRQISPRQPLDRRAVVELRAVGPGYLQLSPRGDSLDFDQMTPSAV